MLGGEINSRINISMGDSSLLPQSIPQTKPVLSTSRNTQPHRYSYCIHHKVQSPFYLVPFPDMTHCEECNREQVLGCTGGAVPCVGSTCENIWGHKRNSAAPRRSFSSSILVNYDLPHFSPSEVPFVLSTTMLLSVSHSALTGDKWSVSWFTTLTLLGRVYQAGPDLSLQAKQIFLLWYSAHRVLLCGEALEQKLLTSHYGVRSPPLLAPQ